MDFTFNPADDKKDALKDFGRNLTDLAARNELEPVIGRDDEIRRIIRILSRKTKNNPVLVGEPGVGKTAIVEGLALKILAGDVPENLKDKEIIELDMGSMLAGTSFQGQFEKRIKDALKKVEESDGQIILFIDEVHTLVGTGKNSEGSLDAAQMLKPLLARGKLHLVGATTLDEYTKYIERDAALERRLQKVTVNEPSEEEAITILRGLKDKLEAFHRVKISDNALVQAVKLSKRYIPDRFLPDKAIDLVDEAAAAIQTEMHSKPEELEKIDQKMAMLKMEEAALNNETDEVSKQRLKEIKDALEITNKKASELRNAWEHEKKIVTQLSELKEKIDSYKAMQQRYLQEGEYEKASILLYKEIPELEKNLKSMEKDAKKNEKTLVKENVTENEIADIVSKWTQIPVSKLLKTERDKLLSLEKHLSMRVMGQKDALHLITNAILRSKANIADPNAPIGSFIFMGPTGVGKTEVAKALAAELFDSEKRMVRIDMSEYMEEHSVARLIGAPPGYVGYDQGGQLTEAIRREPYAIILFDEIEKAHPKVLDVLLQVLDDGKLTDGRGKEVNFTNTIIIMTTNIGSLDILENKSDDVVKKELSKFLRPEFINRIDDIVIFKFLNDFVIQQITAHELQKLTSRLQEQQINLHFSDEVVKKIASDSYNPQFGARPIKRYIKHEVESQLAKKIIMGEIVENNSYEAILKDNAIIFISAKLS